MEEQKRAAEQEGKTVQKRAVDEAAMQQARLAVKQELMEIVPKLKDISKMFRQLDRAFLTCEATMLNTLAADSQGVPIVKVKVANVSAGETIILDPFEFNKVYQVMRDEIAFLQGAIKSDSKYQIRLSHDPVNLLVSCTCKSFPVILFQISQLTTPRCIACPTSRSLLCAV